MSVSISYLACYTLVIAICRSGAFVIDLEQFEIIRTSSYQGTNQNQDKINAGQSNEHKLFHENELDVTVVASVGSVTPLPQDIKYGTDSNLTISKDTLKFYSNVQDCDIVDAAVKRYRLIMIGNDANSAEAKSTHERLFANLQAGPNALTNVTVTVTSKVCDKLPILGMNENYTLEVTSDGVAQLQADSVWGVLRGLETLSQLVFYGAGNARMIRTATILDFPRFPHRGLMLDSSRHFLTKYAIYRNLDLMAQNKMNVFHWHIVDDQSFPFVSKTFPALSAKGAYSANHVYSVQDVAEVIEYARMLGIRVMPEFDTPGHTQSWGKGQPGLLTQCYSNGKPVPGSFGPIDPSNNANYDFLLALFTEILSRFPEQYVHLGGDEVSFGCWLSNPKVTAFMTSHNVTGGAGLEQFYIQKLLSLVTQAKKGASYIVWQEVFDNGVKVDPQTIVHEWKSGESEVARITAKGLRALTSSCWYLNYISYGIDWHKYYACDPQNFAGSDAQKALVMGGEACMWAEYVDATNVVARTWPRASVVAERLWSSKTVTNAGAFAPRLQEHRCRLLSRGYQVEPINGPGFCPHEYHA